MLMNFDVDFHIIKLGKRRSDIYVISGIYRVLFLVATSTGCGIVSFSSIWVFGLYFFKIVGATR